MAEASILLAQNQFSCSICLDLLKDAVTIPCGHSYCMSCITDCWNKDDEKGQLYSCPQCRQTFTTRPALNKNVVFNEMVEKLKKTRIQIAQPAPSYAGPEDVECDVCTGRKYKAVKLCLTCLESYCQTHFEHHEEFHSGRRHKVTDSTHRLHQIICTKHAKLLEIYCRTDQQCVCYLCTMDEHRNHDTVAAVVERTEKQRILGETQRTFQQRIQQREKELQELKEAMKIHKHSAQAAVEDNERIFTELIRSIERRRSEVTQLIRDQEKAAVSRAEGLLERLEQEIDDLKRRDAELEQLSHTDDHIYFLQSFKSLSAPPESTNVLSLTVSSLLTFDEVRKSLSQLKDKLEDFCREESEKISGKVTYIEIISNEPKTREEFLQYSHQFKLDSNTMHKNLCLSEGNRVVTNTVLQQYPDHPDRFNHWCQVLCRESACGRCYWELDWNGTVGISVSYKSISRKGGGKECKFGCNDQSWRLLCSSYRSSFRHNNTFIDLPVVSRSSRIGVYVDHSAGILSFYSVSDTMTLIHREQTTFTQPLYPGFWVCKSTVKLCHQ